MPVTPYRGRIAPSPTGLMHLGHARTFWIAHERALAADGVLLLRDDDLDRQRARAKYAAAMLKDLRWLGIQWQEGPDVGGSHGPYRQSERYALYHRAWQRLRDGGWIYPCTCSRRALAVLGAPHEDGARMDGAGPEDDEPRYPGTCRPSSDAAARLLRGTHEPAGANWRFRVPDGAAIRFADSGAGEQIFVAGRDFGDFVVWRRDDVPAYQLACVVDDAAMGITEVVRGADLLKSTARQLLIYRALETAPPLWHHCALVRDTSGQRLAKRHDALSLRVLRERGLTPEQARELWAGDAAASLENAAQGRDAQF